MISTCSNQGYELTIFGLMSRLRKTKALRKIIAKTIFSEIKAEINLGIVLLFVLFKAIIG